MPTMAEQLATWAKAQKPQASTTVEALPKSYKLLLQGATKRGDLVYLANKAVSDGCNVVAVEEEVKRCATKQTKLWSERLLAFNASMAEPPSTDETQQLASIRSEYEGWSKFWWRP